jgi:D-beta-D-heptose 7-phosphate kinase/D-beta-D-heptose 1-phosphate adenosyltransferase
MHDFDALAARLTNQTVLCVGDLMLDDFVYGEVSRISPEAPAPVIAVNRSEIVIGGAGNVARNIAAIGARCHFVGVIGTDEAAHVLTEALRREPLVDTHLVTDSTRPTTRKVRFVSEHFSTHLLRADWEIALPVAVDVEQEIIDKALAALPMSGIVVLSDYAKGVLTGRVIREIIAAATAAGKPVVVDPKSSDFSIYRGTTLLTPNRKELAEATRRHAASDAEIEEAAREAMLMAGCEAVLVTRSENGMSLVARDEKPIHVPAHAVKVRDVSGAGDTVAAVFAVALAAGAGWELSLRAANAAAAVVVGKRGTATVSLAELRGQMLPHASLAAEEKIVVDPAEFDECIRRWRRQGLRVGFTNGCFDLLHPGHIHVLTAARAACDRLVVGLNSDASVRRLKGDTRPVQDERARAQVLAALEAVDLVTLFGEDTPLELIKRVRPDVLVKGGDYARQEVVGGDLVEAAGGEVILVDLLAGHSTTTLIDRSSR